MMNRDEKNWMFVSLFISFVVGVICLFVVAVVADHAARLEDVERAVMILEER